MPIELGVWVCMQVHGMGQDTNRNDSKRGDTASIVPGQQCRVKAIGCLCDLFVVCLFEE